MEEATKKALTQLNAGLEEVEITVLNEGAGESADTQAEEAVISVRLVKPKKDELSGLIEDARRILETLLDKMDIQGEVQINTAAGGEDKEDRSITVTFNIVGDDMGILIGRRGQTLDALQYLFRLIVAKQIGSKIPIMVDVENYKQRRYEDLKTLALNVASQVKARKTAFRLEPMPAFERRIIHMTLADDPDVNTESTGEGEFRKVVVIPKQKRTITHIR